ncbi:MAG: hypothetical protein RQ966_19915, partial [Acetobacteraceae bacterium]|nr:hypothetical protein [Acetobacteraceae bacterium]
RVHDRVPQRQWSTVKGTVFHGSMVKEYHPKAPAKGGGDQAPYILVTAESMGEDHSALSDAGHLRIMAVHDRH